LVYFELLLYVTVFVFLKKNNDVEIWNTSVTNWWVSILVKFEEGQNDGDVLASIVPVPDSTLWCIYIVSQKIIHSSSCE